MEMPKKKKKKRKREFFESRIVFVIGGSGSAVVWIQWARWRI